MDDLIDLAGGFSDRLDFHDGSRFELDAALGRVEIKDSKGGSYAAGTLSTADGAYEFKKWRTDSLDPGVYHVKGKYQTYNGQNSVIIDSAEPIVGDPSDYEYTPYGEDLDRKVHEFVRSLSPKAQKLFQILLRGDGAIDSSVEDLNKRFKTEYAAIWHHDAYPMGLMAHSYKVGVAAKQIMDDPLYSQFFALPQDEKDLIIVGALLHDLGKTLEYDHGQISHVGRMVSHRTLMSERITSLKRAIVDLYDEDAYWRLQSIFTQHHGKYEETPRTVEAYIVHIADTLDAQLTDLNELMKTPDENGQIRLKEPQPSLFLLSPGDDSNE
jgi:HD superfamily phosphodiesterase